MNDKRKTEINKYEEEMNEKKKRIERLKIVVDVQSLASYSFPDF